MTFLELQDRLMARLNLSTDDARDRLKDFINDRVRRVQTSANLGKTRRGTRSYTLAGTTDTLTTDGTVGSPTEPPMIKVLGVRIPSLNRILVEVPQNRVREMDADSSLAADPWNYAVIGVGAQSVTLQFWPTPPEDIVLSVDGMKAGVDLTEDDDVPAVPEDFHDVLIFGVLADEYNHMSKPSEAELQEDKFEKRLSELRYFISRSIYLNRQANSSGFPSEWWWATGAPWYFAP